MWPELVRDALENILVPVAGDLRLTVGLLRVSGGTASGPTYAPAVPVEAFVEYKAETVTSQDGTEKVSTGVLTFFGPLLIRERDRVQIPFATGVIQNVIAVGGPLDPDTGAPYAPTVWTGAK